MTTQKEVLKLGGKDGYDLKLWKEMMKVGRQTEKGQIHKMPTPMINAIVQTLQFFGLDDNNAKQAYWDLKAAKYKIYDWLGMGYTGRILDSQPELLEPVEKLVKLYILQKDVGGFCWFLRGHDLQVEEPHRCNDCIDSYKNWLDEIKESGNNPEDYT